MRAPSVVRALAAGLVLACLLPVRPAHALFGDEEARKAIIDLRARVAQVDDAQRARHAEAMAAQTRLSEQLGERMTEQLGVLRRSLLELNNQLEALRAENAQLRGRNEETRHVLGDLQKSQQDVGQTLDDRLRKLEPVKTTVEGREVLVAPEERRAFDEAMVAIRGGDFERSVQMLSGFQRRYPASPLIDTARFWLGNAYYGKRDYGSAIASFRDFVADAPSHPRAPEAMLAMANSQAETKDAKATRKTLEDLIKAYPKSEAAQAGRQRLAALK